MPHAGKPIVLGLRPQSLTIAPSTQAGWPATIRVIEPLGDLMDVTLDLQATTLVARTPLNGSFAAGQAVGVSPNFAAAHWFQPGDFGSRVE